MLTAHPQVAAFFEEAARLYGDAAGAASAANAAKVARFIQSEVLRDVQTRPRLARIPVSAGQVADLLQLVDEGTISGKQAKEVYAEVVRSGQAPAEVVARLGMQQVSDVGAIEEVCKKVVEQNPRQAEQLRAGKGALMGFFVGQVMKETKGAANPQMVNDLLKKLLGLAG